MALPTIVKIYNRSDFTVQLPLAERYDGQEFRFTLYTCGEPENGWVASYINGAYTNCTVNEDVVTIYVNNNNNMNPGCLTVRSEYDYFNGHFADNEDNVKDVYKTNIYLVTYRTNSFSASFRPSNLPDLTGTNDYVTFSDINAMGYITGGEIAAYGYITNGDVEEMLSGYATEAYVAEYVSQYAPEYDMTAYVTHDELNQASYAPRTLLMFKQDTLVSGENIKTINNESILGSGNLNVVTDLTGYATQAYVANYVATYAPMPDLSAYVTQDELSQMGYITNSSLPDMNAYVTHIELNNAGYLQSIPSQYVTESELNSALSSYVTENELNNASYVTNIELSNKSYATESYVSQYIATYAPMPDLSAYVTQDELSQMGYITNSSLPDMSSYVTKEALEAASYVNHTELNNASYVTNIELSNKSYATQTYVANYVSEHAGPVDLTAYVTHEELNNACYITMGDVSACGYISSIPSNYATYDAISQMGYITTIPSEYVTGSELSGMSYATQSYVTNYVATYAPTPDLSAYVTHTDLDNASYVSHTELNNAGYITMGDVSACGYISSIPSNYITEDELDNMAYATQSYVVNYVATYGGGGGSIDLSSYVTIEELEAMAYSQVVEISTYDYNNLSYAEKHNGDIYVLTDSYYDYNMSEYVTKTQLNNASYASVYTLTQSQYDTAYQGGTLDPNTLYIISDAEVADLSEYATKAYVVDYVATYGGGGGSTPDLSAYVTKDELNNASYVTQAELSANSYLTYNAFNTYLSSCGYLTYANFQYDSNTNTLTIII